MKSGSSDFDSTPLDTVVYVIFLCHLKVSFSQSVIKIWLKVFMASTKKARFNESNNQCLPTREQSIVKAQLHQNGAGRGGLDSNLMSSLSSLYGRQVNLARVHRGLHYTTNIESKERNSTQR